ncbi:MAG: 5-formyltetrahydrofolate cyclo-ligase [Pseudomonadota bacterium]
MDQAREKSQLRKTLRQARREHVEAQPDAFRALLFNHPPRPVLSVIREDAKIGLYHSTEFEAPMASYARHFAESGHTIALPRFEAENAPMAFAEHTDPFAENDLEPGPFGIVQPSANASEVVPDVVFVPLVGFTERFERLGQGGGHYDRWLGEHPTTFAIGLAWDVQLVEALPIEPHDVRMDAIITPTRLFGEF